MPDSALDVPALAHLTREREGATCIYREFRTIVHAQIERVSTNDWGVAFGMRDLGSPGFLPVTARDHPHRWKASANWKYFHHGSEVWSVTYGWVLYLDPRLVHAVVETADSVSEDDPAARLAAIGRCIHRCRWPGRPTHGP